MKVKIKILKHTTNKVTIKLLSVNRKMHLRKEKFLTQLNQGVYSVLNPKMIEEIKV